MMAGPTDQVHGSADDFQAEQFRLAREAIEWDWGEAYEIGVTPDGWSAKRRDAEDESEPLRANGPDTLRDAITADYKAKPVPRDLPGAQQ